MTGPLKGIYRLTDEFGSATWLAGASFLAYFVGLLATLLLNTILGRYSSWRGKARNMPSGGTSAELYQRLSNLCQIEAENIEQLGRGTASDSTIMDDSIKTINQIALDFAS